MTVNLKIEATYYLKQYCTDGSDPDQVDRNNYFLGRIAEWIIENASVLGEQE